MPHACSHYSLFSRHRLIPVPRKTFFTSTAAYVGIHTSLQALLLMWHKRKLYCAALVQFVLGSKISQIGKQYVLTLLVIKNLFTSLVDGVSLLSRNMLFQSIAAFPSCSVVQALPFPWCCIGCCVFGKCQNCVCLCSCCWYVQMFDGIITI